jgi:hypothetical protein
MNVKKHINFTGMRRDFSALLLDTGKDHRQPGKIDYSVNDAVMSGFACMYFQDPSIKAFQERLQDEREMNNLTTMFGVKSIPGDSQLRNIVDALPGEVFRPVFKDVFTRLQRGKQLEQFQVFPGTYLAALDGSQYFYSEKLKCESCLIANHDNGRVSYSHKVLMAALMCPGVKQVVPLMPEEIRNTDGQEKQDCEVNAAKRLIPAIKNDHPRLNLIIVGDGIYSKQPMVEEILDKNWSFIFVAKPDDHAVMYRHLENAPMGKKTVVDEKSGKTHVYEWTNGVPLNGNPKTVMVNYFRHTIISIDKNGNEKITYSNYWVTNIDINDGNVEQLVKCGRCRWKIENECFNTLKNQGYSLEHNYGHGKQNLCFNFLLLTLIAFLFHQVLELTDKLYQAVRMKMGSKRKMWETLRSYIQILIFNSWEHLMDFTLDPVKYNPVLTSAP